MGGNYIRFTGVGEQQLSVKFDRLYNNHSVERVHLLNFYFRFAGLGKKINMKYNNKIFKTKYYNDECFLPRRVFGARHRVYFVLTFKL